MADDQASGPPEQSPMPDSAQSEGGETGQPEAEIDWQAKNGESQQRIVQLEKDNKSLRGNLRKGETQERIIQDNTHKIDAILETMGAVVKAIGSDDSETLGEEVDQIQAKFAQTAASGRYEASHQSLLDRFSELVGEAGLDLQGAPELEGIRQSWNKANNVRDIAGVSSAFAEGVMLVSKLRKGQTDKAVAETRKSALDEAAVLDTDTGPSPGAATGLRGEELWKAYGRGEVPWSQKVKEAGRTVA